MMPNTWFYKLKDISRGRNHSNSQYIRKRAPSPAAISQKINPRYSYYHHQQPIKVDIFYGSPANPKAWDTHFPDSPRKSSKRRPKRKTTYKPSSVSDGSGCPAAVGSVWTEPEEYFVSAIEPGDNVSFLPEFGRNTDIAADSLSCSCGVCSSTKDIFIDVNEKSFSCEVKELDGSDTVSGPARFQETIVKGARYKRSSSKLEEIKAKGSISIKIAKEGGSTKTQKEVKARKRTANSAGVKLRTNSPRLASRKMQAYARKSVYSRTNSKPRSRGLSGSCAVVKAFHLT